MKVNQVFFLLAILPLISCVEQVRENQTVNRYYDVDSLLSSTATAALKVKGIISVQKEVSIDGKQERQTIQLDTTDLNKELEIFRILDINKSSLAFSYEEKKKENEISYQLKSTEKQVGIISLNVTQNEDWQEVSGVFLENNSLYYTSRMFKFNVENGLLKSYEFAGTQKMMFKDTIHYSMKGEIIN